MDRGMNNLEWKTYKGVKYAFSNNGFFWVVWPSGLKGQISEATEDDIKRRIDALKIAN